jgi:hypothetical protein
MRTRLITIGSAVAALLFVSQFVALGVAFGVRMRAGSVVASVAAWAFGVALASRARAARVVVAALAATLVVVQLHVFRYFHTPLDVQVAATAIHAWPDVRAVVSRAMGTVLLVASLAFALEYAILAASTRAARLVVTPRRSSRARWRGCSRRRARSR